MKKQTGNPEQIGKKRGTVIGTPTLDKWLIDNHKTGLDIPPECWGLANAEYEKSEIGEALNNVRKNLNSRGEGYSSTYRRNQDSIMDIWCPIFERIALEHLQAIKTAEQLEVKP